MNRKLWVLIIVLFVVALVTAFKKGTDYGYERSDAYYLKQLSGGLSLQCHSKIADAQFEGVVFVDFSKHSVQYAMTELPYDRFSVFTSEKAVSYTLSDIAGNGYVSLVVSGSWARLIINKNDHIVNYLECEVIK
ncbi:hypothetical protein ASE99_12830 [Serratia sp. Leaf51]|nr:hypothetical protein ASE99_12830 [Serratia sp. Leaf51]